MAENRLARRSTRRDRNRRRRAQDLICASKVSPGAKALAHHLLNRSNDSLTDDIWGLQSKIAEEMGRSERQITRYTHELEAAGLCEVIRFEPKRQHDGKWRRLHTNKYCFKVPPASPKRQKPSSREPDMRVRQTNNLSVVMKPFRPGAGDRYAQIPPVAPWHEPCAGTRWIEHDDGSVSACECMFPKLREPK